MFNGINMGMGYGMGNGMGTNPQINMMSMMQMFYFLNALNQNNNNNNNGQAFFSNLNNQNNQQNSTIPRNKEINCDPFKNIQGYKINITFESSAQFKMNMPVPVNLKLKDLFKTFIQRAGLGEGVLGKQINFIYNALYVNPFEEKTLQEYGITNFSKFLVIDVGNLLGGLLI